MFLRFILFITVVTFIGCSLWLGSIWTHGNRTADWVGVEAYLQSSEQVPSTDDGEEGPVWKSVVEFEIEGATYESVLEQKIVANEYGRVPIYINPDKPTESVLTKGHSLEEMQIPLWGTLTSGVAGFLFLIGMFLTGSKRPKSA